MLDKQIYTGPTEADYLRILAIKDEDIDLSDMPEITSFDGWAHHHRKIGSKRVYPVS